MHYMSSSGINYHLLFPCKQKYLSFFLLLSVLARGSESKDQKQLQKYTGTDAAGEGTISKVGLMFFALQTFKY